MLTPEQVADYLRQNPGFFEQNVDLLVNIQIPHPHGGRAVSIVERQLVEEGVHHAQLPVGDAEHRVALVVELDGRLATVAQPRALTRCGTASCRVQLTCGRTPVVAHETLLSSSCAASRSSGGRRFERRRIRCLVAS